MDYTTHYNLAKPSGSDPADIGDINDNMDKIDAALNAHEERTDNPHNVNAMQVGLGNVPNVSTNDQTPIYTEATALAQLDSGEKMEIAFGKLKKAVSSLVYHLGNSTNPHSITYTEASAITEMSSGEAMNVAFGKIAKAINTLINHMHATNPHNVNATQVGLGHVDNVSTDDQTPNFSEASTFANISSGEKMSVLMGKIKKAISSLSDHLNSTSNPHSVTKSQVGLGNVPNVATNNQTPTYTVASSVSELSSGETLSTAFGKIAKAVKTLKNLLTEGTVSIVPYSVDATLLSFYANVFAITHGRGILPGPMQVDAALTEVQTDVNALYDALYYKANDTFERKNVKYSFIGMHTANTDSDLIYITIPVDKSLANITNVQITKIVGAIRTTGGYAKYDSSHGLRNDVNWEEVSSGNFTYSCSKLNNYTVILSLVKTMATNGTFDVAANSPVVFNPNDFRLKFT